MIALASAALLSGVLRLYPGYVTKVECQGRLLVSSVGNDAIVERAALPKELGCGVLLKALAPSGRTNLILETSVGSIEQVVEIVPGKSPSARELIYRLQGGSE